jgi:hypothetical protein
MPASVAGIHVFLSLVPSNISKTWVDSKTWKAGTKPDHDDGEIGA